MGYLEQFARNKRRKEKSEVLTARLPQSLYSDFKAYCDELGLSISEAVCLLVEREVSGDNRTEKGVNDELATTLEYKTNTDTNRVAGDTVVKTTTNVVKPNTRKTNSNTKRFTTKQWQIDGLLPCPICDTWSSASNFSVRHSKKHGMTTEQLFTSEEYKDKITAMINAKRG